MFKKRFDTLYRRAVTLIFPDTTLTPNQTFNKNEDNQHTQTNGMQQGSVHVQSH